MLDPNRFLVHRLTMLVCAVVCGLLCGSTTRLWADLLASSDPVAETVPTTPAAETSPDTIELLKVFAAEFVVISPGQTRIDPASSTETVFPTSMLLGDQNAPESQRRVVFAEAFAIARYEVPQNLYTAVCGRNPSRWAGPRNSVEQVNFEEANTFCRQVTALLQKSNLLTRDEEIRLPTADEWEYCCRAGTNTAYSFGDDPVGDAVGERGGMLGRYAWYHGNAAGNDPAVGVLAANPWGLYDMHGYLWEWTSTVDPQTSAAQDPADKVESTRQNLKITLCGGSWKDDAPALCSHSRRLVERNLRDDAVGLRCVKVVRRNGPPKGAESVLP